MINKLIIAIICFIANGSAAVMLKESNKNELQSDVRLLSEHLETFNKIYLTTLDQKITSITSTMSAIDTGLKLLQEKAHVWDIFRYHIDAWNDHMKAVDHKIDLIKRTQDDQSIIENKISNLEFKISLILNKMEKIYDGEQTRIPMLEKKLDHVQVGITAMQQLNGIQKTDLSSKLSNILRHVLKIDNGNCRTTRSPKLHMLATPVGLNTATILKDIDLKLDSVIKSVSLDELKKFISDCQRTSETIDEILEVARSVNDLTLEVKESQEGYSSSLVRHCDSMASELSTFTGSADLLLKRAENLVLSVQQTIQEGSYKNINDTFKCSANINTDRQEKYITTTTDQINVNGISTTPESFLKNTKDFHQPSIKGCHDLSFPYVDGVYYFNERDLNIAGRDFNERYCMFLSSGKGWTVIQRRGPYEIQENFNRSWTDYKSGFGSLTKDFWFGLEFVHLLTNSCPHMLRIEIESFDGREAWAEYTNFHIESEFDSYSLLINDYEGNASDALSYHANIAFSTFDKNNDNTIYKCCPCASGYGSGWWYDNCSEANLNGIYRNTPEGHDYVGIIWERWLGDYSLKAARMLIQPTDDACEVAEDP